MVRIQPCRPYDVWLSVASLLERLDLEPRCIEFGEEGDQVLWTVGVDAVGLHAFEGLSLRKECRLTAF